jgi:hypothetical protein
MLRRLGLSLASTAAVTAVSLAVQASVTAPVWAFHRRSAGFEVLSVLVAAGNVALALLPSRLVALGGGPIAGGLLANVVSAQLHGGRVPNPFVVGEVAFNLADVFVVAGAAVQTFALAWLAIRLRSWIDARIPPRRWERRLRRRLGL